MAAVWQSWCNELTPLILGGLFRAAIQGGAALCMVYAITRLPWRLRAAWRCWLWRVAYLKLILALFWATPLDLPVLPSVAPHPGPNRMSPRPIATGPTSLPPVPTPTSDVPALATALWLLGAGIVSAGLLRQWMLASRLRRDAQPLDDPWLVERVRELGWNVGARRGAHPPSMLTTDAVPGPVLAGGLRSAILLPTTMVQQFGLGEVRLTLAHELAHWVRHDLLWSWLPALSHTLLYFHPLVWIANREYRLAQEMAADELALAATQAPPSDYAHLLIQVTSSRPAGAAVALAAFGADHSPGVLRRRIEALAWLRPVTSTSSAFGSLLVVGLAILVAPPWRLVPRPAGSAIDASLGIASPVPIRRSSPDILLQNPTLSPGSQPAPPGLPARPTAPPVRIPTQTSLAAASEPDELAPAHVVAAGSPQVPEALLRRPPTAFASALRGSPPAWAPSAAPIPVSQPPTPGSAAQENTPAGSVGGSPPAGDPNYQWTRTPQVGPAASYGGQGGRGGAGGQGGIGYGGQGGRGGTGGQGFWVNWPGGGMQMGPNGGAVWGGGMTFGGSWGAGGGFGPRW